MTNAIDNILQATQSENPLFAEWGRPGNDVSVVVDRLLVNPEAINELFTGDYTASGEDPSVAVLRWVEELKSLKQPRNVLTWSQRLQALLFGKSYSAAPLEDVEARFQALREEFDELVSARVSSLVNMEAAVSWLTLLVDEFYGRGELNEEAMTKLLILNEYRKSMSQISRMDEAIIRRLQASEQLMEFTALELSVNTAVAKVMDTKINLVGGCR